ncbi:MAG TPA: NfeD family protein [Terriglobales bacterium]|nr:NfeD family protein [Terriglobales bacterium]
MTWENFYLVCFVVGFAFSVLSFLGGGLRWHLPFKWHVGHAGPHVHLGHAAGARGAGAHGAQVSAFNLLTLTIFLAWFGGTGYLLTRYSTVWFLLGLGVAILSGIGGAAIIFFFLKALMASEHPMDPADYEMVGVLGKVTSSIRAGGTGEITYSQGGTRHAAGARSEDNNAIAKGSEVVVTRYEHGIAYVRRWEEMAGMDDAPAPQQASGSSAGGKEGG